MMRPCIEQGCPNVTPRTRCAIHHRTKAQLGYGAAWQAHSRAERQARPWCQFPGCDRPAHSLDHTTGAVLCTRHHPTEASGGVARLLRDRTA